MTMAGSTAPGGGLFPSTRFSLIARAVGGSRDDLGALAERYRTPLLVRLRTRWGLEPEAADEAVQDFLVDRLVAGNLARLYDPSKGRFRALLRSALDNHVRSGFRGGVKEAASFPRTRWGSGEPGLDEPEAGPAGPDEFDVAWALELAASALGRMRRYCLEGGQARTWEVFARRLLGPALWGAEPASYEDLARELGYPSAKHAADALTTAKRTFGAILPDVARGFVPDAAELASSLDECVSILARCGAERTRGLRILLGPASGGLAMTCDESRSIEPVLLARLLEIDERAQAPWSDDELGILLRHLLDAPVQFYLSDLRPELARKLRRSTREASLPIVTLSDLLAEPEPDADLLVVVKDFARAERTNPDSPLPRDIAAVVYYLCIALASVRSGREISALAPAELRRGLAWACGLRWIGPDVAATLHAKLDRIDAAT